MVASTGASLKCFLKTNSNTTINKYCSEHLFTDKVNGNFAKNRLLALPNNVPKYE